MQIGARSPRPGRFLDRSKSDRQVSHAETFLPDRYAAVKTNSTSGSRGFARYAVEAQVSNPTARKAHYFFSLPPSLLLSCVQSNLQRLYLHTERICFFRQCSLAMSFKTKRRQTIRAASIKWHSTNAAIIVVRYPTPGGDSGPA